MSENTPFMRLHGARMLDAGFHVIPIIPSKKSPGEYANGKWFPMAGWSKFAHLKPPEELVEMWSNWPGAGVGIVTGGLSGVIGVDIDALDTALASQVRLIIQGHLGETPLVRIGKAPKLMMVYRVDKPMNKISMSPLEVLATGQQFVAYGVHPDTGLEYHWSLESPDEALMSSIPVVTEDMVQKAVQAAYDIIPSEMKQGKLTTGGTHTGGGQNSPPATIEAIIETLNVIPNDNVQWDDWKRILMAVFVSSRGSEQAYFELLKWSRKSAKHNDVTTRHEWNGCRVSVPQRINFGTLHYIAKQHGWVPSDGLQFNEEKKAAATADVSEFNDMPIGRASAYNAPAVQTVEHISAPRTRICDIVVAQPEKREEILRSVGIGVQTMVHPGTGELVETLHPLHDTDQSSEDFVKTQMSIIYEDNKNLFRTEEPEKLRLTQDEIKNGSLPLEFANEFPKEWLYSDSLIGRIAQWIDTSCLYPHRLFALMAAFTMFGTIVGRQYRTQGDLRPSLSVCIIGPTGSGKEHPRKATTKLMLAAEAAKYIGPRGWFKSGSGVVEHLQKQPSMWLPVDELGKKIAAYSGKGDQNQREMVAMVLEAVANDYIGGIGYANSKEHATRNVQFPNLNVYGSSQIEELTKSLSSDASNDGFIQRFLFVPTFADYVPMRKDFKRQAVPDNIVSELKDITSYLAALGGNMATNDDANAEPNMIVVEMTQQAKEMWEELDNRKLKLLQDGRKMWVRSPAQTIKIAMLEAIATDPKSPVITVEGMDSARKLVDWFTRYAETFVITRIADNDTQRSLNKVKQIINDAGPIGISFGKLTRKTQTLSLRQLNDALTSLVIAGEIEKTTPSTGKAGRPPTVFRKAAEAGRLR